MCGITGIWGFNGAQVQQVWIEHFNTSLSHRGPDASRVLSPASNVYLGHTRLKILDPTDQAGQPMSYGGGRYHMVYNGEIYNFLELKKDLKKAGYQFSTDSDTEVVLASYNFWGEQCQERFNGMWAFAIYDTVTQRMFLSRDRFGVKPLFYKQCSDYFIFASELKAFMSLPRGLRPDFNQQTLAWMNNIEDDCQTLLEGVENLNAGYCGIVEAGSRIKRRKWWRTIDHLVEVPEDYQSQVEQYRELFLDSCRIRMVSDVPLATALSGGLDSSAVVSGMASLGDNDMSLHGRVGKWQDAFFLRYVVTPNDEIFFAQQVCSDTGIDLSIVEVDDDNVNIDDVISSVFALEAVQNSEPGLGPWLIYKSMQEEGFKISVDGHGGDETLAGYEHYLDAARTEVSLNPFKRQRYREILSIQKNNEAEQATFNGAFSKKITHRGMLEYQGQRLRKYLKRARPYMKDVLGAELIGTIRKSAGVVPTNHSTRWIGATRAERSPASESLSFYERRQLGYLNAGLYEDFHSNILPRILRNFDRLSMSHGVESRAPFLDWRLVCLAFSLPSETKIGGGFSKRILRDSMKPILPQGILKRRSKIGFSSTMSTWLQNRLGEHCLDVVNTQEFLESAIWDGGCIRHFLETNLREKRYREAEKAWKFVQSFHLIDEFKKRAHQIDVA